MPLSESWAAAMRAFHGELEAHEDRPIIDYYLISNYLSNCKRHEKNVSRN